MDMPNKNIQKALKIIPPTIEKEVTGIISPDRVSELASMDINYVSVGAITNQAPSGNFNFKLIESLSSHPHTPYGRMCLAPYRCWCTYGAGVCTYGAGIWLVEYKI